MVHDIKRWVINMVGRKHEKIAKVMVNEVNSIDRLNAMFEIGMMLKDNLSDPEAFGLGCGSHCDAAGLGCGSHCLQGLDRIDEVIKARYAIDVMGEKLTGEDMAVIRDDFEGFHEAVVNVVNEKLSLKRMQERIDKYGR